MARADLLNRLSSAEPAIRFVVEAALVIGCALIGARLIWLVVSPGSAVAEYRERPLPSMVTTEVERVEADLTLLVRQNPFIGGAVSEAPVEDAPETKLNLKLDGVMSSDGTRPGSAYITLPNNQQGRFVERSNILPDVVLKRVLSDRVVLTRDGVDEILYQNASGRGLSVIGDGSQPGEPRDVAPAPVRTQVADPDRLLQDLSVTEARSNGRLIGYRLEARGDLQRFQALGFMPGDVVTRINGQNVQDIDQSELLDAFGAYQEALIDIDRGGRSAQVILEFDE